MNRALRILLLAFLMGAAAIPAVAQNTATISGRVLDSSERPITDATVTLVEARRTTTTDSTGAFSFSGVPPGRYHVSAESRRAGAAVGEIEVSAGASRTLEMVIDPAVHTEEIVVTASPDARGEAEVYQPVNVISAEELQLRLQPTLGETLNAEPGVSSTYFGPGASRPVIRGLGADRIRVLEEGVGTGDASSISPDHAVSLDPANAEQIEIVRGAATLLYGSSALGGVVNVLSDRIPDSVPAQAIGGSVDLRGGTVADQRSGSLVLNGGSGSFAWHADFSTRETDDYEIPGPAEENHEGEEEHAEGILENSAMEAQSGTIGGSWIGTRGFIGIAATLFDTKYGVPGHEHHEEEGASILRPFQEEEEALVKIDLEQKRFDLKGELLPTAGPFRNLRLRLGTTDYEHVELEGEEIGTRFTNDSWEARLEASHRPFGALTGALGVQLSDGDFAAIGEESIIPRNTTEAQALFLFEEVTTDHWDFQFGGRFESLDIVVESEELPDRSFDGLSGSFGLIYRAVGAYALAASIARAERLPTAQELYVEGPHLATGQFEIGDVNLDSETSLGIDLSLRKTGGRVRGEMNFFNNQFNGYIFEGPTGEEEEGFPVFQFTQADARFRGMEIATHTELWHADVHHLELELGGDYVRATLDQGGNLPRIPPLRFLAALRYRGDRFSGMLEGRHVAKQDEVAQFETETDAYTLLNAMIGFRFFVGNTIHDLTLRGTNLTDELARNHVSPLKDRVPLPGRDVNLSYRLTF